MYEKTDKKLQQLLKQITRLFNRYRAITDFDELNVIKNTKDLYSELEKLNDDAYLEIANYYYQDATGTNKKLSTEWLLALLLGYDYVTRYVDKHEVERKRARLAESLIATHSKIDNFKTAKNLWWKQTSQYAISISDEAQLQGYRDAGVEYVVWNSVIDGRECEICRKRNGKVYAIDKVPAKPHYNCRCHFTPYKKVTR